MKPEVNAVLAEVKQSLAQPSTPDFKTMSIMEATKWCMANGITKAPEIANLTGKKVNTIHTAQWKLRNPKRVKSLARRAKKVKELKIMLIKDATKGKSKTKNIKVTKPKISDDGLYDDGMETPWRDSIMRRGGSFVPPRSLDLARELLADKNESDLMAENRRLKILVEHYEALLFKGGK